MQHNSSKELVAFLTTAHPEIIFDLCKILGDRLGFNGLKSEFSTSTDIPKAKASRRNIAEKLVLELEYFSANNIAYWSRAVISDNKGVGYHEALQDVCEELNKQLKTKVTIPRVASVAERENLVCSQILGIALQGKTDEEITRMLSEAGLEVDAKKTRAIQSAILDGSGTVIIGLVKLLGKKTVTNLAFSTLQWIITKKLGKEAAEKLIMAVAKQATQKTIAMFASGIGVALIAWDVLSLAGAATRVTIPAVALISTVRCAKRLESESDEA